MRKVTENTDELLCMEFSKSTVSDLCLQLDPLAGAWNNRPLVDSRFLFL
ncbi:transposase [Paenibacillus sp. W2I17]